MLIWTLSVTHLVRRTSLEMAPLSRLLIVVRERAAISANDGCCRHVDGWLDEDVYAGLFAPDSCV